ncbi:MAG: hypothetical protein MUE96_08090 [Bacteroidia bacterium]|jgi:hypothetical protein|nr:hypothetical protein [Bacteroidia bacterium]
MSLTTHTAAGQALGYFFQIERAMSWLAKSPSNSVVGIETEDDVVVILKTGERIHEQDKSSTTNFPFNPSRPDLWKTLLIWLNALNNQEIDFDRTTFYLVTNKVTNGSLAETIGNASTSDEINACVASIKEAISNLNGEVKGIAEKILEFEEDLLKGLISKIIFSSGSDVCGPEYRKQLISDLQIVEGEEVANAVINSTLGWLFNQVTTAWRNKQPALIERDDFIRVKNRELSSYRDKVINDKIFQLGEVTKDIEIAEHQNNYIKQLKLINVPQEELQEAISDYLNTVNKKTLIAKKGYITEEEINQMNEELFLRWQTISRTTQITYSSREKHEIGRLICLSTLDHNAKIGEFELRGYFFTRGSYHSLSDSLRLGWHPEYVILMNNIETHE